MLGLGYRKLEAFKPMKNTEKEILEHLSKWEDGEINREEFLDFILRNVLASRYPFPSPEEMHQYGHQNWLSHAINLQTEVVFTLVKAIATDANMGEKTEETPLEAIMGEAVRLEARLRLHKLGGEVK